MMWVNPSQNALSLNNLYLVSLTLTGDNLMLLTLKGYDTCGSNGNMNFRSYMTAGTWYHIAFTILPNSITFFLDGK